MTGDLHNGSAGDFGSLSEGSIPSSPATLNNVRVGWKRPTA